MMHARLAPLFCRVGKAASINQTESEGGFLQSKVNFSMQRLVTPLFGVLRLTEVSGVR